MRIKEFIVVEGKSDSVKIKQAVDADTIETNGSAVSKETIQLLRHAHEKRGIIVLTDPDYAGQRIRHIITEAIPTCKHAFLPKAQALPKQTGKSVGIEHATVEAIRKALKNIYEQHLDETQQLSEQVTKNDLIHYGLIGQPQSSAKRKVLGEILRIGKVNGKQLLKRLTMFHITKAEFEKAMIEVDSKLNE